MRDYDLHTLREKFGFVLQKPELFSGTLADNIRWGNEDATDEEVKNAAIIAQAHDFIVSFNDEYDTVVAEKGASPSGGQKQRMLSPAAFCAARNFSSLTTAHRRSIPRYGSAPSTASRKLARYNSNNYSAAYSKR